MSNRKPSGSLEQTAKKAQATQRIRAYTHKTKSEGLLLSKYPLRITLPFIIALVTGVGLLISNLLITNTLQRSILDQVDTQLTTATSSWANASNGMSAPQAANILELIAPSKKDPSVKAPPSAYYVMIESPKGIQTVLSRDSKVTPDIRGIKGYNVPQTVPSEKMQYTSEMWRAIAVKNDDGSTTYVALSLLNAQATITRLISLQLFVGGIVLLVVTVLGVIIVRRALMPLSLAEKTAREISQGDLQKRIPQWKDNTEVGQLARALNTMLAQIQSSFSAVKQSEALALDAQKEAQESEKKALDAEDNMRRFIGDASHELRTPLTSVQGYAELYSSGAAPDADWAMDHISSEAQRMRLLVEDLLSLVRMEEGRELKHEAVDLLEVSLARIDAARAAFPGRDVDISTCCNNVPMIMGDVDWLHQVIGNLLTNALSHGGNDADVSVTVDTCDPETVRVRVSDTGIGIAEKDLAHIFDRFYRTDVSRSRASGGSGLGLAIVQRLVEAHNGDITVESTLGEGTTFTLTFPALSDQQRADI